MCIFQPYDRYVFCFGDLFQLYFYIYIETGIHIHIHIDIQTHIISETYMHANNISSYLHALHTHIGIHTDVHMSSNSYIYIYTCMYIYIYYLIFVHLHKHVCIYTKVKVYEVFATFNTVAWSNN